MNKVQLEDIAHNFGNTFLTIRNKYNRIDDNGVNHGRSIYYDKQNNIYYKLFHKDYCRLDNFIKAYKSGFFQDLAPALTAIIYDRDDIVGYVSKGGKVISDSEFDTHLIPQEFTEKLLKKIEDTKMFFYDFIPSNIITLDDGSISLIDLESVYNLTDLFRIKEHGAVIKPDFLYEKIYSEWRRRMKPISFIQPSRSNLKYLKWSYNSIRRDCKERPKCQDSQK